MNLGGEYYSESELRAAGFRSVGRDVKVHSRASLYQIENIALGDYARIDDFAIIIATGPVDIGAYVHVPNYCYIAAGRGVILQDFVTLAPGVQIFTKSDDYLGTRMTGPLVPSTYSGGKEGMVTLEKHVIVGTNSVILPGCTLAEGCAVGALSLVKTDLEPWAVYAGAPVKRIAPRSKALLTLRDAFMAERAGATREFPHEG